MRIELSNLVQHYANGQHLYLVGPVGCGKTYVLKHFPFYLASSQVVLSGLFLYISAHEFVWDENESCDWQLVKPVVEACHYRSSAPNGQMVLSGWKPLQDLWKGLDLSPNSDLKPASLRHPEKWGVVLDELTSYGFDRVVVMVDNYDRWTSEELRRAYLAMEPYRRLAPESKSVLFWLAGEDPLSEVRDRANPKRAFLNGTQIEYCNLLDQESLTALVKEAFETQQVGLSRIAEQAASPKGIESIARVSGFYPVLAKRLVVEIAALAEHFPDWDKLLHNATDSDKFKSYLRCLYSCLDDIQKQTLAIVAIAQATELSADDVRLRFERRSSSEIPSHEHFEKATKHLWRYRLLLNEKDRTKVVIGSAMREWVNSSKEAKEIREMLGLDKASDSAKQIIFARWLMFGVIWYLFAALTSSLWRSLVPDLVSMIYFVGFLPAVIYLTIQLYRKQISSVTNHPRL